MGDRVSSMEYEKDLAEIIKRASIMKACLREGLVSKQALEGGEDDPQPEVLGARECLPHIHPPEVVGNICYPEFPQDWLIDPKFFNAALEDLCKRVNDLAERFRAIQHGV